MHAQERVALRAKITVDAGTKFEKYTYLTNDLLQSLTTRYSKVDVIHKKCLEDRKYEMCR